MKIRNLCAFVLINWLVWCILSLFYFKTGGFSGDFYGNLFTVFFIPGQMSLFAAGLFILSLPFRFSSARAHCKPRLPRGGDFSHFFLYWTLSSIPNTAFTLALRCWNSFLGRPGGKSLCFRPLLG